MAVLSSCRISSIETNDISFKLVRMEEKGEIQQSEKREEFFYLFDMNEYFTELGYGYRIDEIQDTWRLYEDKEYFIFTGTVAKADKDYYIFLIVLQNLGEGDYEFIFEQIGREITLGEYPSNIIPNI